MNITTLEQAGRHLMEVGAVDIKTMMVEGRRLLEACGLDTEKAAHSIARQIDKHGFEVGKDLCTSMGKSTAESESRCFDARCSGRSQRC